MCVCVCVSIQQGQSPGQSKDWALDPGELEAAFSPRTKMIVVNNPNNPLGKVATMQPHNTKQTYFLFLFFYLYYEQTQTS